MKKDKKQLVISGLAIVLIIVLVVSATYAYFASQVSDPASTDIKVTTGTVDNLTFTTGAAISITATQSNFGEGAGNLSGSTTASATLVANNTTNSATAYYNLYLIIDTNEFEYTVDSDTAELIFSVKDPNGDTVESISGLTYTTVTDGNGSDVSGFDITTRTGGFKIASNYEITSTGTETQEWIVTVTLVNLDSDQNANAGKIFSAQLYITQEEITSYELIEINSISSTTTYNSITANLVTTSGTADAQTYYFGYEEADTTTGYINTKNNLTKVSNTLASADTVTYYESNTASYQFNNLKENTTYIVYSYAVDTNGFKSNIYSTNITTDEYEPATISSVTSSTTYDSITVTVSASDGEGTITKYYYSSDGGDTYVSSDSNEYTFEGLSSNTTYSISIYVEDSNGEVSNAYVDSIITEYVLPVINSVSFSTVSLNSLNITVDATDGDGEIVTYYYSIDKGNSYESSLSNNYTFDGLTNGGYYINIYVEDSNGRISAVYSTYQYMEPSAEVEIA